MLSLISCRSLVLRRLSLSLFALPVIRSNLISWLEVPGHPVNLRSSLEAPPRSPGQSSLLFEVPGHPVDLRSSLKAPVIRSIFVPLWSPRSPGGTSFLFVGPPAIPENKIGSFSLPVLPINRVEPHFPSGIPQSPWSSLLRSHPPGRTSSYRIRLIYQAPFYPALPVIRSNFSFF